MGPFLAASGHKKLGIFWSEFDGSAWGACIHGVCDVDGDALADSTCLVRNVADRPIGAQRRYVGQPLRREATGTGTGTGSGTGALRHPHLVYPGSPSGDDSDHSKDNKHDQDHKPCGHAAVLAVGTTA